MNMSVSAVHAKSFLDGLKANAARFNRLVDKQSSLSHPSTEAPAKAGKDILLDALTVALKDEGHTRWTLAQKRDAIAMCSKAPVAGTLLLAHAFLSADQKDRERLIGAIERIAESQ